MNAKSQIGNGRKCYRSCLTDRSGHKVNTSVCVFVYISVCVYSWIADVAKCHKMQCQKTKFSQFFWGSCTLYDEKGQFLKTNSKMKTTQKIEITLKIKTIPKMKTTPKMKKTSKMKMTWKLRRPFRKLSYTAMVYVAKLQNLLHWHF